MRVHVDSSALIKRAVEEVESDALGATFAQHIAAADVIVSSSLTWIEVSRGLRSVVRGTPTNLASSMPSTLLSQEWQNVR